MLSEAKHLCLFARRNRNENNQRFFAPLRMTMTARRHTPHLLCAPSLDLDVDRNRLADAGDCLGRWGKHQIEVASRNWLGRHCPARPASFVDRRQQFHMKRGRPGHAVHRKIAENIAALRAGPFDGAALERDLGKLFYVKEFRAAQMIVSSFYARVDAARVDLRRDRGILRMLTVDFDLAAEPRKFSVGGAEELMHSETDRRTGRIELVGLGCRRDGTKARD